MTTPHPTRRTALVAAGAAVAGAPLLAADPYHPKGRVKHSIVHWCFASQGDKWDTETMCRVATEVGCVSVELIDPQHWPTLKKHGLTCAIAGNGYPKAGFMYGLNNPVHSDEVIERTRKRIDECADFGVPSVIAFTGYKWRDPADPKSGEISSDEGAANCVKALKELAAIAEKKNVTVCIEHLNTRDTTHPMKGHPGYQGDDLDYLAGIVRKVGSKRVKVLFDVYHVQAMHGDLVRRIDQNKDVIGHVHTAGNPGRGELDDAQEIAYPAVMRKLLEIGYAGHVGHEFIPTRDPRAGLAQAVKVCDV
jgi:hydroxypyruvate isomerase